ncbi:ABC transporter permease [Candidatus Nanosalina sp. VS9-1]|uniref:ABC transporter permease n=1 Tax=Candidatus Nanosalina sp. VS9-1 TaxID=3388566 RepID=UPI0039E1A8C4
MIEEFFKLSYRNIRYRGRRSILTVIGVFIGIAAVVALVSLSQGLQTSVENEFQSIGADKLFISAGQSTQSSASDRKLMQQDLEAVRNVQGVDAAGGALFRTVRMSYQDEQAFGILLGIPTDETREIVETSWAMEIESGRSIRPTDTSSVVIGSSTSASKFEEEIGLRRQLEIEDEEVRVVGVMKPTGDPSIDGSVLLPLERSRELLDINDETYDWIFARMQPGFEPDEVKEDVEEALRDSRDVDEDNQDFSVSTQEDLLESFNSILGLVRGVVIGIASISLLVGAVGIMNTMYTSVTERTREIGVMKAIGATRKQILTIFLIESGIIGMIGGLIGLLAGLGLSTVAAMAATELAQLPINPYISAELVVFSLGFAFLLGMISGFLPARKAANLEPAEALRYE